MYFTYFMFPCKTHFVEPRIKSELYKGTPTPRISRLKVRRQVSLIILCWFEFRQQNIYDAA